MKLYVLVTASETIHLYIYLERLKQKALYCDIHSVIFIQPDDQPALVETGEWLGAMKTEFKPGLHIEKFGSGGLNYAYRTVNHTTGERGTV
jgi:hypothetical protein